MKNFEEYQEFSDEEESDASTLTSNEKKNEMIYQHMTVLKK